MSIIVITPAIPRPDLHSVCIGSFYKNLYMNGVRDDIDVYHIVNLDVPEKVVCGDSGLVDRTIENLNRVIPGNVKRDILLGGADFTSAYRRVFMEAEKYMRDGSCIIYLEDDWEFLMKEDIMDNICRFSLWHDKRVFYSMSMICISNNPIVYSYRLALEHIDMIKHWRDPTSDPDFFLRMYVMPSGSKKWQKDRIKKLYYRDGLNNDYNMKDDIYYAEKYGNYNYYEKQSMDILYNIDIDINKYDGYNLIFISHIKRYINCVDCGREWANNNGIKKWNKRGTHTKTY